MDLLLNGSILFSLWIERAIVNLPWLLSCTTGSCFVTPSCWPWPPGQEVSYSGNVCTHCMCPECLLGGGSGSFPWLCFNLRLNQEVSSKLAWQKQPVELREIKFLFPLHWGILTKTLTAKVITLGFCSVLNLYMTRSKIILGFYLLIWITDMCATKAMSEDCRGTFCKSTKQVLDLLFSSGYALLAGCSQTMHQLQIKREYSLISPPKYIYPSS